jgi:peptide/nickel transport system substrate-binding protein
MGTILRSLAALVLAFGLALPAAAQETPVAGGTLTVALDNDAKSLDPTFQTNFSERQPQYLIFNTLFALQSDFSITGELAKDWTFNEDGTILDIELREGVTFHDGTEFNAEAVKWNLDHRMDETVQSLSRAALIAVIDRVEVVDTLKVRIVLKQRAPDLLGNLSQREGFMISPTSAQEMGDRFGSNPVGTGPFVFKEWLFGNRIVLEKNQDYWEEGKPYLDRVIFIQTASPTVGIPRLLTGEIQAIGGLTPTDIRPLENNENIQLIPSPGSRWVSLHIRSGSEPFNELKVRQAIAYGIDRQKIIDVTMAGLAKVANGPTPAGLWWSAEDLPSFEHDPEKARELLAEAGYADGVTVSLAANPSTLHQQIAQLVQEQLAEVGITVDIQPVSTNDWLPQLIEKKITFIPMRWTQRPDPDSLLQRLFHSESPGNYSDYANPEVDRLLTEARVEPDQEKRKELYRQIQVHIAEDLPYINLFFAVEYIAVRSDIRGFEWIPDEIIRYRDVWIQPN